MGGGEEDGGHGGGREGAPRTGALGGHDKGIGSRGHEDEEDERGEDQGKEGAAAAAAAAAGEGTPRLRRTPSGRRS